MTLDEIDSVIAAWNRRLTSAAQNLMDLHALPTYQRLAGSNGQPKAILTGATAGRVHPILNAMGTLFQNFDSLKDTIDRAASIRQNISPLFGSDQKVREIHELLFGKSIHLPAVPIPMEQRSLLSAVENVESITPEDLMNAMVQAFTAARDTVLAIDAAWEKLGATIDHAAEDLAVCRAQAEQWSLPAPELKSAEEALETVRAQAESDPLTSIAEYDTAIAPALDSAHRAFEQLRRKREQIAAGLQSAGIRLRELEEIHKEAVASWTERREKVALQTEPPAPQPQEVVQAILDWLDRLNSKFHQGMLDPIAVGLERWNKSASDCVSLERAAYAANRGPLEMRNELRGRLDALKAKARGRGIAENSELTKLAFEAGEVLFTRPTPLEKASALVVEYERTLNQIGNKATPAPVNKDST
ncbi:MAG TPA: hypothetical protein VH325_13215 [Bryobacteraceae bacterium]|jgi:hypothetical protein|nr:hypothetical protein [Bryobacteraceae bacterium]